ncbi:Hypothetical protein PBC10988_34490 [Planctomycetales bacterium 10988]|nr:Hypothetical protein PBC10988_34490 [Planctomycetales bacterium 10988]
MSENHVVIYSNGIADFQRSYQIPKEKAVPISLPVRKDHLADVLGSFNVYGQVRLDAPLTYRPSNDIEGSLEIVGDSVLESLAEELSGAKVKLSRSSDTIEGTLVGLNNEQESTGGDSFFIPHLIVLTNEGLKRCAIRDIENFQFLDADIQSEIEKALLRNYQSIKPNSTFIDLTLSALQEETEAILQYTLPAAAWKISYRLRMKSDKKAELQGFAIVDNNTEEDWNEFLISVVTGEPITFSTDLAETKVPKRDHVNLVIEKAPGSVEVEAPVMMAAGGATMDHMELTQEYRSSETYRSSGSNRMRKAPPERLALEESAQTESAQLTEVGDFSIFHAEKPVNIPAHHSSVIPIFQLKLDEAKTILHYKVDNHETKPYRCVNFKNQAGFHLGKGMCTVFEQGHFAGSSVLPSMKPEDDRLLPHALETGVTVTYKPNKRRQSHLASIEIVQGVCKREFIHSKKCTYTIQNNRKEPYELFLDHQPMLREPTTSASIQLNGKNLSLESHSELKEGIRYKVQLEPKATLRIKVYEEETEITSYELFLAANQDESAKINWILTNLLKTNGPLAENKDLHHCFSLYEELNAKREEISDLNQEMERIISREERLRENIKSGGKDALTTRWRKELDDAEKEIQKLVDQQIPQLREEEKKLRQQLSQALKSLSTSWKDETPE